MEYIILAIALVAVVWGADNLVNGAVAIARRFKISDFVIGAVIVGIGTSLPELAASVAAAMKKNSQIALGNIVGSNIFNITFILGLSSQITPLQGGGITFVDYVVMIVAAIAPIALCRKGSISRIAGTIMLIAFVAYNVYLIHTQNI